MAHVLRNIQIAKALDLRHAYGESGYAGMLFSRFFFCATCGSHKALFSEEVAHKQRPLTKIVRLGGVPFIFSYLF